MSYQDWEPEINELVLWTTNNAKLHDQIIKPTLRNFCKMIDADTYIHVLALKQWFRVATVAAKDYHKEYGGKSPLTWDKAWPVMVRRAVASRLQDYYEDVLEVKA